MSSKNQVLEKKDIRNPEYKKGKMSLSWSVDFNSKTDLRDSTEIFERVLEDLKEQLNKLR